MKQSDHEYPLSYVNRNLESILVEMVKEYSDDLSEQAAKITEQVANDFAQQLKEETPRSNMSDEHLADTVQCTAVASKTYGRESKGYVVHYGKWQIAHLLEFGWTLRNGKRMDRTPFVRPLFDRNRDKYYNMYKEGLSK